VCKSQTNFAQRLVESEGEMTQGRQRQPFEMPFTFSLNNILSIIGDRFGKKKHFWRSTLFSDKEVIINNPTILFLK
jgi:hypothetical protein